MLPKSKRLNTEMFKGVIGKGQSFHGPFLLVRLTYTEDSSRFAVSVPKKVEKTAVGRNHLKRQVYEIIKSLEDSIGQGLNVTVILKVGSEKLSYAELKKEVTEIFVKSGVLK